MLAPQRSPKPTRYELVLTDNDIDVKKLTADAEDNKFVQLTLKYTLLLISSLMCPLEFRARLLPGLFLHLKGDRQFYSSAPETKV